MTSWRLAAPDDAETDDWREDDEPRLVPRLRGRLIVCGVLLCRPGESSIVEPDIGVQRV